MSSSQPRANTPAADAGSFPILMRLPDLRSAPQASPELAPAAPEPIAADQPAPLPQATAPEATGEPPPQAAVAVDSEVQAELQTTQIETPPPVAEILAKPAKEAAKETPKSLPLRPDVTDTTPPATQEPVSPAAARRQRALERQRRQATETPSKRTWWTSHFPIIAIGFLLALVLTVYIARYNRNPQGSHEHAAADPEVPMLDIDMGGPSESPTSSPPMLAEHASAAASSPVETKPAGKSPPLLTAKPKLLDETPSPSPPLQDATPTAAEQELNAVAPTDTTVPVAAEVGSSETRSTDETADYPSTDPTVHRPGGRVPRTARTYPETSTPRLR